MHDTLQTVALERHATRNTDPSHELIPPVHNGVLQVLTAVAETTHTVRC